MSKRIRNPKSSPLRPLSAVGLALAALSVGPVHAGGGSTAVSGKAPVPAADTAAVSPWDITAAAGFGMSRGNTDTLNLSAQFLATYLEGANEGLFGMDYGYAETGDATTVDNFHAFGAYNRTLAGGFYAGLAGDFAHDEIAELDYRFSALPMLGYYLIKNDSTLLALEAGAGYVWEDQGGIGSDYYVYRVGQRFSHSTAGGVKLTESVQWTPAIEDSDDWLLTAQAGISVPVSKHWAVGAVARYTYDNTPASGLEKDDLAVLATLSYSLKGFEPEAAAGRRSLMPDQKKAALPDMGWSRSAGVSFALNQGNSDTLSVIGDLSANNYHEGGEWLNAIAAAYGETDSEATVENVRAATQYNKLLSDPLFVGIGAGFRYDDIAKVDYQVTPTLTLGAYLVRNDAIKLSVEAGPGYVFEKVGDVKADYLALYGAQKLAWVVNDRVTVSQAVVYSGEVEDLGSYTLTATGAVDVSMVGDLSFRASVSNIYDSTPAAGLDENDLLVSAGIAMRF